MTDRHLAAVWLLSIAMLGGVVVSHAVPRTTAYFTDSKAGSITGTIAKPVPCNTNLFSYSKSGAQTYPMLSVHIWANAPLPGNCNQSFSMNAYTTQGPDWAHTGTQTLFDHQTITLDSAHPSGTLTVQRPECFGQTDFYIGTTRFDGVDGAMPHYPEMVVPQPLIAWSNGGKACKGPADLSGSIGTPVPGDSSSPAPSASPAPTDPPVLSTQPPVVVPPPSSDPTATPDPTNTPTPAPTPTLDPTPTPPSTPTPAATSTPEVTPAP